MRMRIEKAKVSWEDLYFDPKHKPSVICSMQKLLVILGVPGKMVKVGMKRALDCSCLLLVTRHQQT